MASINHCKVQNCKENHSTHHCRYCKDADSNHFSSSCPYNKPNLANPPVLNNPPVINNPPPASNNSPVKKCKVTNCQENHEKHYCKNCLNSDADHFSSKCPNVLLHCKVPGCTEAHEKHYCRTCKNSDSDHFARNCAIKKCKVKECDENHLNHHCVFCGNNDSDHFARDCPDAVFLFHATKVEYLKMKKGIREMGLKPSNGKNNRFGEGIYFAEEKYAKELAVNYYGADFGVLLKCRVKLGKCKDFGKNQTDPNGDWTKDFDSCTAIHPKWYGNKTSSEFKEWIVSKSRNVRIYSLTYKGKEFKMVDYKQDKDLLDKLQNNLI